MKQSERTRINEQPVTRTAALAVMVGAMALALAACGGKQSKLEPVPEAETVGPAETVQAEEQGVVLQATVDAWPGAEGVLDHVTPVRVTIRNQSDQTLRLQYRYFSLMSADAKERYAALPPFKIEGTVTKPVINEDAAPLQPVQPAFRYRGFEVAPFYGTVYPELDATVDYPEYLDYDLDYYDMYYTYWRMDLPTPEMLARVIPEGIVQPGGEVDGFVYFQKVDPAVSDRVQLHMALVNAQGQQFGMITQPFAVQD